MIDILPLIVGAGIGYITNWLAIKMLFKPHKEIKLKGFRVPFTPGLIPKERKRIAKSISRTINDYLLTDEVLIKELTKEKTIISIENNIYNYLNRYFSGQYNLQQLLDEINVKDVDFILKKMAKILSSHIINVLEQQQFINQISNIVTSKNEIIYNDIIKKLQSNEISDKIIKCITNKVADKSLQELLGDNFFNVICEIINTNMPNIIEIIKNQITNEKVKDNIIDLLNKVITDKIGAIGAMFISANSLYNTLIKILEDKLNEENTELFLSEKLQNIVMKAKTVQLDKLLGSENSLEDLCNILIKKMIKELENENKSIKNYMNKAIDYYIRKVIVENNTKLMIFIEEFIYEEMKKQTYCSISLSEEIKIRMKDNIIDLYKLFIKNKSKDLFKVVDLANIIEDEINSFDINVLENMILSIARKELKAITWFGALLGLVLAIILLIFK